MMRTLRAFCRVTLDHDARTAPYQRSYVTPRHKGALYVEARSRLKVPVRDNQPVRGVLGRNVTMRSSGSEAGVREHCFANPLDGIRSAYESGTRTTGHSRDRSKQCLDRERLREDKRHAST